ncbi:MAG TPA: hypothetical protein VFB65_02715 [Pyrinomonadaceae bacterium]|nr:hypothetical protein [Pyrinomonadaceae bacterium]
MDKVFSQTASGPIDFIAISAVFLLTMLCFFALKDKRYLNTMLLVVFVLLCVLSIVFHEGLTLKLFAALMLVSTLIVEVLVTRKRNMNATQ